MFAGAAVELGHALAADRLQAVLLLGAPVEDERELGFEFVPLGAVEILEMQRSHVRRPNNH